MRRKKQVRQVPFLSPAATRHGVAVAEQPEQSRTAAPATKPSQAKPPSYPARNRPVNNRFVLALLGGSLLFAAALFAVHWVQVDRSADRLRRRAEVLVGQGENRNAAVHLREYLRLRPGDIEARALLGEALEKFAATPEDRREVYAVFEEVLRRDPSRTESRRAQIERALRLRRPSDARSHLDQLFTKAMQDDAELHLLSGRCCMAAGKFEEAADEFRTAIELDRARWEAFERLAAVQRREMNRPDEARKTLDLMVAANPESGPAYFARARARSAESHFAGAAEDLRQARQLAPDDLDLQLRAAGLLLSLPQAQPDDLRDARQRLDQLVGSHADNIRLVYWLALLDRRLDANDTAKEWLLRGLSAAPRDFLLRTELAALLIELGREEEAHRQIARIAESAPLPGLTEIEFDQHRRGARAFLEASLLMRQEKWTEAKQRLLDARPDLIDWPELEERADFKLAACYRRLDDWKAEVDVCHRILRRNPTSIAALSGLVEAYAASGHLNEALRHYDLMSAEGATPAATLSVLIRLSEQLFRESRFDEAQRLYEVVLRQDAENVVALNNLAWILSKHRQQHAEALSLIARAQGARGPLESILDTRGEILMNAGRYEEAAAAFESALARRDSPITRFHLALAQRQLGRDAEAATNVQKALDGGLLETDLQPSERESYRELFQTLGTGAGHSLLD